MRSPGLLGLLGLSKIVPGKGSFSSYARFCFLENANMWYAVWRRARDDHIRGGVCHATDSRMGADGARYTRDLYPRPRYSADQRRSSKELEIRGFPAD